MYCMYAQAWPPVPDWPIRPERITRMSIEGRPYASLHCCFQQYGEDPISREEFFRDFPTNPAVFFVVAIYALDAIDCLGHVRKSQDALAGGQPVLQTCILDQHRPAGCEIT